LALLCLCAASAVASEVERVANFDDFDASAARLARAFSGQPLHCRRLVDHFEENGELIVNGGVPASTIKHFDRVRGQVNMHKACESLFVPYLEQSDAFVSGQVYGNDRYYSFEWALATRTDMNCRMVLRGIANVELGDTDAYYGGKAIQKLDLVFNTTRLVESIALCTLSDDDDDEAEDALDDDTDKKNKGEL